MKNLIIISTFICFIFPSCSDGPNFEDHALAGNYLGEWEGVGITDIKLSIDANEEDSGLIFFFSLASLHDMNIISDSEFTIDRFIQNSTSIGISGNLIGDTLYLENDLFQIADQVNTQQIRNGKFVRQ